MLKRNLAKLYFDMLRIRMVEEKLTELYKSGLTNAPVHLSIGQEAVAVGIMAALEPQDKIVSTHRCHAHYLAKGGDLKKMLAEIFGKTAGCCGGKGGSMHLFDDDVGHMVSIPLVGASISLAVGLALSFKMRREDKIAVAFFGDGAVEEGIFWESLNFASVQHLPILFICENNLYSVQTPILTRQPSKKIISRIRPHLFDASDAYHISNANDAIWVRNIAEKAVEKVRKGRPCFIEAYTYRWREHWGVGEDWHMGYRSREEGEKWMAKCPLKCLRKNPDFLIKDDEISEWIFLIEKEINEAVRFAMESPAPSPEELTSKVGGLK